MIQRTQAVVGVLGLVLAAGAAHAAVPGEITIDGTKYKVTSHSLAGTYKNAVQIKQVTDFADRGNNRRNNFDFVPGDTPDKDRLFVVAAPDPTEGKDPADQFYLLAGSDAATGDFNTKVSSATQFFGGTIPAAVGGRPTDVTWISDEDTGKKKDRNILLTTFFGDDHYRFYDLDSIATGDYKSDDVDAADPNAHIIRGIGAIADTDNPEAANGTDASTVGDPNSPYRSQWTHSRGGPNGTLVVMATPKDVQGAEVNLLDPKTGKFVNLLTNVNEATNQALPVEGTEQPHSLAWAGGNEFWFIYSDPDQGGNGPTTPVKNQLVKVQMTFPTDLNAGANKIQVKLLGTPFDFLTSGISENQDDGNNSGIFGLALGRAINGKPVVYLGDWNGNLITLTPQ